MNRFATASVVALSLPVLLAVAPVRDGVAMKCAGRVGEAYAHLPKFLTLMDGEVVGVEVQKMNAETVAMVEILCWDAAERLFGVMVRNGVTSVFTKPGPNALVESELSDLAAAQSAYFAEHEAYSDDVAKLLQHELPAGVSIDLTATATSWTAYGWHRHVDRQCHVSGGSRPPHQEGMTEWEPVCVSQRWDQRHH